LGGHLHFDQVPPRSWEHFEELCADTFQEEFQDPTLVRNGRTGQAQHGVDIVARHGALWVGIQCKKKSPWPPKSVTIGELDAEVEKAKAFRPALRMFFFVSTALEDEAVGRRARQLTRKHRKRGLFDVVVIGWSELVRRATRHNLVASKHFGSHASGPLSPLLASWTTTDGKLSLSDRELAVSTREIIHDLDDFPNGRITLRQTEAEDLQFVIKRLQAKSGRVLKKREAVLDLRDQLKRLRDREASAVAGLMLLFGHKVLRDLVRAAWQGEAPLLVRSFVEQALDPDFGIVTGLEKIRIYPPGLEPSDAVAVFIPGADIVAVKNHHSELKKRYPKLRTDNVGELPERIRFQHALPAMIRTAIRALEAGTPVERLERERWFEMSEWRMTC
jgi:hypothetical protein